MNMKKTIAILPLFLVLLACGHEKKDKVNIVPQEISVSEKHSVSVSKNKAIVFEKQAFALSKTPNQAIEDGFQKALDNAYLKAVEANSEANVKETGFIYSAPYRCYLSIF